MTRSIKRSLSKKTEGVARSLVDGDPGTEVVAAAVATLRKQSMPGGGNGYPMLPLKDPFVLRFHPQPGKDDDMLVLPFPAGSTVTRYGDRKFTIECGRKSVTVELVMGRLKRVGSPNGFDNIVRVRTPRGNYPQGSPRAVETKLWL